MTRWPVPPAWLRQPDDRSCGAATVVAARLLVDPSYAEALDGPTSVRESVLAAHARITGLRTATGAVQLPWPRALGTPPWAVAAELAAVTGRRYRSHLARWSPATAFDRLAAAPLPSALYVGSRILPRHVMLVVGATDADRLRVLDPALGALRSLTRADFADATLPGSWSHPWLTVTPVH